MPTKPISYYPAMHFRRLLPLVGTKVNYSEAGGRSRFASIERGASGHIVVRIYGNVIARIFEDRIQLNSCAAITPSTKDAIRNVVFDGRASVSSETPGSRGGKMGEWKIIIHAPGFESVELPNRDEWIDLVSPKPDFRKAHECDDDCRAAQARSREVMNG